MEQNARVYIARHTGLIGSAIHRRVERAGMRALCCQRAELDLSDGAMVERFFATARPDYVVLDAGKVGGIAENLAYPADFLCKNLTIQLNVLAAAHRACVKKLIFFASSCMYPRDCPQPMAETALLAGRPEPSSLAYAMAKLAGLQMCLAYNQQYSAPRFIPVIPNSVYGPNDNFNPARWHVLSALIRRFHEAKLAGLGEVTLWGTGTPRREFIHADDVAEACFALLAGDTALLPLPLNIGVGVDLSIRELASHIAGITGFAGEISWDSSRPDGAPRKLLDSGRMRGFGWTPRVNLEARLRETYQWYQQKAAACPV